MAETVTVGCDSMPVRNRPVIGRFVSGLQVLALSAFLSSCASMNKPYYTPEHAVEVLETLSADYMQGRLAGSNEIAKARTYLTGQLEALGLEPYFDGFQQPFEFTIKGAEKDARRGFNLGAIVRGRASSDGKASPTLVITAHYDHEGVKNGEIYNGADDNASGVGALLAVAESFQRKKPKHDTLFLFLDAEEQGLVGARHFVSEMTKDEGLCVALNVNLDMVSRNAENELYAAGGYHTPTLKPFLDEIAAKSPVKLLQGHDSPEDGIGDWTLQSDHGPFHRAGVPFIYFGVEDHAHYHRPTDDFETIPVDFYLRAVSTIELASRSANNDLGILGRSCPVAE